MDVTPTPFDSDAPLGIRRAIIRRNPDDRREIEMVEATWGADPRLSDGASLRFVRSEGRAFPICRCLISASEFHIKVSDKRYRVTLDGGNFFYLADVWQPATDEWPLSYRIVTVVANPDIARYQERHGAIIHRRQVMRWLDGTVPDVDLLAAPPARTFLVERIDAHQASLAL